VEKQKNQKETKIVPEQKKPYLSTELFKDKIIPSFIKEHTLFKSPTKVNKVFRSIGLPNFSDKTTIDKSFENIKKEGSYVFNLLSTMNSISTQSRDNASVMAEKIQYLSSKEERESNRHMMNDLYILSDILGNIVNQTDPYNPTVLNSVIHLHDGKVVLKLMSDIKDTNDKIIFKKDKPLFGVFDALKEKCSTLNVPITNLEQTAQFKLFSKENMPNKEYSIVFSSEGREGAWDIATMSMRGIKSCQRWDGEYPRCLIGSILSKFVGIIYLTSGVKAEDHPSYPNLGTKMLRRCIVRYAVDADEDAPCILVDKMYPEYDKEVCTLFIKSLQLRTKLPVHYAPELGNKIRHIYMPSEKVRDQISNRDWSYQDTALKSKHDLNVYYLLNSGKDEIEREVKSFRTNLPLFFAKKMEDVYNNNIQVDEEIRKTIKNIKMNVAFTPFCENLVNVILSTFPQIPSKTFTSSKAYYRKFLMETLMNRKKVFTRVVANVKTVVQINTSRTVNMEDFTTYLFSLMAEFIKLEMAKVIN
jgi:hypothetical protein